VPSTNCRYGVEDQTGSHMHSTSDDKIGPNEEEENILWSSIEI